MLEHLKLVLKLAVFTGKYSKNINGLTYRFIIKTVKILKTFIDLCLYNTKRFKLDNTYSMFYSTCEALRVTTNLQIDTTNKERICLWWNIKSKMNQ